MTYDRRIAALPHRVDRSVVRALKSDMRRMTKIYNSIPTEVDNPRTAEMWEEARRLFARFRENLEEWVYKVLIQHSKSEKDTWAQRQVREKAWTLLHDFSSGLFPEAWNYKTQKHEPAPWLLKKERPTNIRRYQRHFRDFIRALEDLIEAEGGSVTRAPQIEQHNVSGMNVVIHNLDRDDRNGDADRFLRDLGRQAKLVERAGFRQALRGLTVHVRFDEHGLTAGQYSPRTDTLTIFTLGQLDGHGAHTFIHEVGHRFYWRNLPNRARAHWEEVMKTRTLEVTPKDVDVFMDKIYKDNATSRELEALVDRARLDPETKAKLRYLADHSPVYVSDPKGVSEHHRKFNVGDKVTIEHISDYGATDPMEAFAEAFQLYIRKGPRVLGPWTRSFFEKITRSRLSYDRRFLKETHTEDFELAVVGP